MRLQIHPKCFCVGVRQAAFSLTEMLLDLWSGAKACILAYCLMC